MYRVRRRLPSSRAEAVEEQLRARSEQLKPRAESKGMPLGYCRACQTAVYAGDTLAMSGVYLLHGECTLADSGRLAQSA